MKNELDDILFDKEEQKKLFKLKRKNIVTPTVKVKLPKLGKLTWNPKRDKYTGGLSSEQKDFVKSDDNKVLLVASAGSGKTQSLTSRVIDLIHNKDADPERILLITFTVKAGEEMRSRVENKLGEGVARFISCGTFHSFAVRMLRKYTPKGLPKNFSILDAGDAQETWLKCAEMAGCVIAHTKALFGRYSMMRNCKISAEAAIKEKWKKLEPKQKKVILHSLGKNIKYYTNYKKRYAMYDFDDLLEMMEYYLEQDKNFRIKVSSMYDYVLIDEIQDCNAQQLNIIKSLVQGNKELRKREKNIRKISIYGVGDPSQSIYHFRGADHHLMESFPEMFNAKVASLVTNYRSTSQILELANAIGENFTSVRWKNKMVGTYDGEKPYYVRLQDEHIQADFVVDYISKWLKSGVPGREIAILYRSNNMATPLEIGLTQKNILFEKRGGQTLFEMAHIKDILAFFKAAFYASDVIAWTRIFQLHRGVGSKSAQKLYTLAYESGDAIEYIIHQTEYEKLQEVGKVLRKLKKCNKFIPEAINIINNYVIPILQNLYSESWDKRKRTINSFFKIISRMSSIKKMLTELALNPNGQNSEKESADVKKQGGKVIISTVHSFKGLEANNVFIVNCNDGKFPSDFLMYDGKVPDDKKKFPPDPEKLDEERRLFYVACTRARHNLIIVSPMSGEEYTDYLTMGIVKAEHSTESQFIQEIDIDSLANIVMPVRESETTSDRRLKQLYEDYE